MDLGFVSESKFMRNKNVKFLTDERSYASRFTEPISILFLTMGIIYDRGVKFIRMMLWSRSALSWQPRALTFPPSNYSSLIMNIIVPPTSPWRTTLVHKGPAAKRRVPRWRLKGDRSDSKQRTR